MAAHGRYRKCAGAMVARPVAAKETLTGSVQPETRCGSEADSGFRFIRSSSKARRNWMRTRRIRERPNGSFPSIKRRGGGPTGGTKQKLAHQGTIGQSGRWKRSSGTAGQGRRTRRRENGMPAPKSRYLLLGNGRTGTGPQTCAEFSFSRRTHGWARTPPVTPVRATTLPPRGGRLELLHH